MDDYSHFRGYLHTHGLRWTFGALKDSPADRFQQRVSSLPLEQFLRQLAVSGFSGIYLDRTGYADNGAALEASLRPLLGAPVAARVCCSFFSLVNYARDLRATMTPERWEQERRFSLTCPVTQFLSGFADQEVAPEHFWRWCSQDGELDIENTDTAVRRVRLRMLANTGVEAPAHLELDGDAGPRAAWTIGPGRQPISVTLDLPPGVNVFHFRCDAKPIYAPLDTRVFVWSMTDFQIEEDLPPLVPMTAR